MAHYILKCNFYAFMSSISCYHNNHDFILQVYSTYLSLIPITYHMLAYHKVVALREICWHNFGNRIARDNLIIIGRCVWELGNRIIALEILEHISQGSLKESKSGVN